MSHIAVPLKDIILVFFKLGITGFGGPAAHIAMMREEVVERRKWMSEQEFFDLVGATNLIPGPNSTELAIHIGHKLGGWRGLLASGCSFILPAFFSVLLLAIFYKEYGSLPQMSSIMGGIKPVIIAIVFNALLQFRKSAIPNYKMIAVAAVGVLLASLGFNEVIIILSLGLFWALINYKFKVKLVIEPITISLFLFFLKVGSVLFGSGYVLLAFLQNELVEKRMWLTQTQMLDAIAVGQFTPGPVFTTATFVGYLINGNIGATVATIGIFLPSFFFVLVSAPYLAKLRHSHFFSKFLDAVNASSFALMVVVCFQLGQSTIVSYYTALMSLISFIILLKFKKLNSAWLIILGGVLGFFLTRP